MKKYIIPSLVFIILIITLLLSSRMIFAGDFFYLADQARDMLLVQDIVENKNLTLIGTHSGLGGFFHGPLWLYQLVPYYLLGQGDPYVFTYAYVAIALVTVLVGFFVGAMLYGKKVGLLFAFILAVSPSIWAYVPNTIGVNMVPLVFLPMFYFLIKYIRGDQKAYIFAIFFAGLSLQYETALPLILLPVVVLSFFLNKKALKNIKVILLSILSLVISLATFIFFDVKHNFLMTKALLSVFTSGKQEMGYLAFPERIYSHMQSLRGVYETVLINKSFILIILLLTLSAGFIFLVKKHKLYKKKEWKELLYLCLFPIFIFIPYLAYGYPIFPEYLLGLTIPVALAFSLILLHLWSERWGKLIVIIFLGITLFEAGKLIHDDYFTPYQMDQTAGSYLNQKAAVDWIWEDSAGKSFGYFVYSPNTYTYGMDYLMWWSAKDRGSKSPESKKLATTYLILGPTLDNDLGAHTFWKKYKIRTNAKVLERKKFPGNIIVEKLAILPNEEPEDPTYHQSLIFR